MINKKAFEIQFNWIFVLVAGTAILLFFTAVVVKQKSASEISTKSTVLKSIEAIITGASVSTDTINIVDIPNSNIEVSCNRISIGEVAKQYQNLILFAPNSIKGNKLITQTLAFSVPYRATNLLYTTSPQIRYIIIGNNNLAREINKSLPSDLKKEFYESSTIPLRNENNYKIRFIFFGNMIEPSAFKDMPDSDVTAIKIVRGDLDKGTIEFYKKNGNAWSSLGSSVYIRKPSLIGAIYSDTKETYECNMRNAFSRLKLVTKIYAKRAEKLVQAPPPPSSSREAQCNQLYNNALPQLTNIDVASSNLNNVNVEDISNAAIELSNQNKEAQKFSCPLIY